MPSKNTSPTAARCVRSIFSTLNVVTLALAMASVVAFGCSGDPEKKEARPVQVVVRDVPAVFRGTVGAETTIRGVEPVLVSGLGIVVGLNGTGGGALPTEVAGTMERMLSRGGIGLGSNLQEGPLAGKTPRQVLEDPNVAVVVVEGVIAPGAPNGWRFDVRVRPVSTGVTSLEGGMLWSTDLRLGQAAVFGAIQTKQIAVAKGPIFINPFSTPGESAEASSAGVSRTIGRILDGGLVTDGLPIELVLDNPSHQRASSIQSAINNRFPAGSGDDGPTAKARNMTSVAVRIPRAWRGKPGEFVQLVRFTQIDTAFPQDYAKRYADEMVKTPGLASELSWCMQALGRVAVPFLAPVYDCTEPQSRLAALRAGAKLGDARSVPYLKDIAQTPAAGVNLRSEAIALLGDMGANPQIDLALRELINAPELPVRVAAYEAMAMRGDPQVRRTRVGEKFWLEAVPAKEPLIYVTQQGTPRVVLIGDARVNKPSLASAWEDRLMLAADSPGEPARVFYRDYRTNKTVINKVGDEVRLVAYYMGHSTTPDDPEPGLGLSYSEVVGALYELQRQGALPGAFATEQDRLLARINEVKNDISGADRPESEAQRERVQREVKVLSREQQPKPVTPEDIKSKLVPLGPVNKEKK